MYSERQRRGKLWLNELKQAMKHLSYITFGVAYASALLVAFFAPSFPQFHLRLYGKFSVNGISQASNVLQVAAPLVERHILFN